LIYFIFRYDTYVISFVFTCLVIIGGFAAGVGILLVKGPSRDHILKIRKIPEKYQEIIFSQKTQEVRRRIQEEPGGALMPGWRGLTLAAPALCEATLAHFWSRPFTYFNVPKNLIHRGAQS
jgi:hypothetical protein